MFLGGSLAAPAPAHLGVKRIVNSTLMWYCAA